MGAGQIRHGLLRNEFKEINGYWQLTGSTRSHYVENWLWKGYGFLVMQTTE